MHNFQRISNCLPGKYLKALFFDITSIFLRYNFDITSIYWIEETSEIYRLFFGNNMKLVPVWYLSLCPQMPKRLFSFTLFNNLVMARNNSGVLGNFTGTIGPVTGFMRNGHNFLRSSTSSVKNKRTPLQRAQQEKINICTAFVKAFSGTGFLNKSFPAYGHSGTGYNRAISALMSRALTGEYPDMALSYPQVLISKGSLPGAQSAKVIKKANNTLQFSFADNSGVGIAASETP